MRPQERIPVPFQPNAPAPPNKFRRRFQCAVGDRGPAVPAPRSRSLRILPRGQEVMSCHSCPGPHAWPVATPTATPAWFHLRVSSTQTR